MANIIIGKIAPVFKGEWNTNVTYTRLDIVKYWGSSYVCIADSTIHTMPDDTSNWLLVAEKGDDGHTFTYADFTPEQIAELQRPATDAAQEVAEAEDRRSDAEYERVTAEQRRVAAEQQRAEEFAGFEQDIKDASIKLFNDTWTTLVGIYGRYDPNGTGGADHPYMLNGLWFTYKEAIEIVAYANTPIDDVPYAFIHARVKTLIPPQTAGSGWSGAATWKMTFVSSSIETLTFTSEPFVNLNNTFYACAKLRAITTPIHLISVTPETFTDCTSLKEIRIIDLHTDISFADSPLLSLTSVSSMVNNARGEKIIWITVHPDTFAKLNGDMTNEAAAATPPNELAQWQELLGTAGGKKVSFVSA